MISSRVGAAAACKATRSPMADELTAGLKADPVHSRVFGEASPLVRQIARPLLAAIWR